MVPQNFTKSKVVVGKIENEKFVVQGRKIAIQERKTALSEIRKNLFEKHNSYLRIKDDQYYNMVSQEEVIGELLLMIYV